MLDRLNELVAKKVDTELLRQSQSQNKQELLQQIDMVRSELNLERQSRDAKLSERVEKCELNGDRSLDEIFSYKEQLRQLQEERKRDIEETADFIKQVMETNKQEFSRDLQGVRGDLEKARNDIVDRCSMQEVLNIKQTLLLSLDSKVDVKEVQNALNECQQDLAEQLTAYKTKTTESLKNMEVNLNRVIDRKVDHKDLKQVIDSKADRVELVEKYAQKAEHDEVRDQFVELVRSVQTKLAKDHFDQYEKGMEQNINEIMKQLGKKSSIKDVCALLDMKSNTEEVNKALDEIHSEMDKVLVTKSELANHL